MHAQGLQLHWKSVSSTIIFLWIFWNFKNVFFTEHIRVTAFESWKVSRKTTMPKSCPSNLKRNALSHYWNVPQPWTFTKEYLDYVSERIFNKTTFNKNLWAFYFFTEAVHCMSSFKVGIFKNFVKFTGKHQYQSVWLRTNKIKRKQVTSKTIQII